MLSVLLRLSFTLAATRLVAITMPIADFILLAHVAPSDLAAYALGAQWAHIGVVACGALGVGIAILLPRCTASRRKTWLPAVSSAALAWGISTALLTLCLALIPTSQGSSGQVTAILAIGMVPLSIYASLAAYCQSTGRSRFVLKLTALAGVLNVGTDLILIKVIHPALGVACATTACWSVLAILMTCEIRRQRAASRSASLTASRRARALPTRAPWKTIRHIQHKALFRIALPDFLSKVGFVGTVALAFWWLSSAIPDSEFTDLAITLNYMNVVFVVLTAITTAFGITFLDVGASHKSGRFANASAVVLLLLLVIFILVSPASSYIYFAEISAHYLWAIAFGTAIVLFDGVSLFAITLFRMHGAVSLPPYLRLLMFPVAAAYVSLSEVTTFHVTLEAMLFGNVAVALCACVSCASYVASKRPVQRAKQS